MLNGEKLLKARSSLRQLNSAKTPRETGEVFRDARLWNGVYLDIFVYPESKLEKADETMLHMRTGKVLLQKGDLADRFISRLEEIYKTGPKKLPPDEVQARKTWAGKMLNRAKAEDAEGNFRRAWLLTALLEDYFAIRGVGSWPSSNKLPRTPYAL